MTKGLGGRQGRKGLGRHEGQNRPRKSGAHRTKIRHSLQLGKLVKFSKIREERFDGLDIVHTEDEQRPKIVRWFSRIPWLGSASYWLYFGFKWWSGS